MASLAALYVLLMQDFGWTIEQAGEMTIPEIEFISMGWKKHPPIGLMVAGGLGIGKEKPKRATKEGVAEFAKFLGK